MRKLSLQVQISVDGFIGGPNGEMDWMTWNWDEELMSAVTEITQSFDTIVLGRKLAEGFIPHWAAVAADSSSPEQGSGKIFTDTPKVVFSKTLDQSPWANTQIAKGDLREEIGRLKRQSGKDIIAYGGAQFVASLIEAGLIDEFNLFVNPVALGQGLPIFRDLQNKQNFKLVKAQGFDCGITLLRLERQ